MIPTIRKKIVEKEGAHFTHCLPADILLTASNDIKSIAIQNATCANVSHAALMIDQHTAIEAVPPRVGYVSLSKILDDSTHVYVLRHKSIVASQAQKIVEYAQKHINKPYDFTGATHAGLQGGCMGILGRGPLGMVVNLVNANLDPIFGATASFFCTELVGKAFESVGLSLSKNAPWLTVPGGYVYSDQLDVVKQLKP